MAWYRRPDGYELIIPDQDADTIARVLGDGFVRLPDAPTPPVAPLPEPKPAPVQKGVKQHGR